MKTIKQIAVWVFCTLVSTAVYSQQQIVNFGYDEAGNRDSRSISVSKITEPDSLKSQELQTLQTSFENSIKVYPNPTYGKINIDFSEAPETPILLTISDQSGRLIEKSEIQNASSLIDLSTYERGVYFLTVATSDEKLLYKILKQ